VTLAWQRAIRAVLAPHDLTHVQFVLLASLWWIDTHHDQPPTQTQLAEHSATDPMMTSQVIRKLSARGLVDRTPDPGDGRARRVQITDAGRRLAVATITEVETADHRYFSTIDDPHLREALLQALNMLAITTSPEPAAGA